MLLVLENPSELWGDQPFFDGLVCNGHNNHITVIVIERLISEISHQIRNNTDVIVAPPVLDEHEMLQAYDGYFGCYDQQENFAAAHAHEVARGARLVFVNGPGGRVADVVRSLVVEAVGGGNADRAPFTLLPTEQARTLANISAQERLAHMGSIRDGQDIVLSAPQTLELFRASDRVLDDFAHSRHLQAVRAEWIPYVLADLLAITETSCGHMPRVICELILEYL